jgi:4-aminobutyrate aminotransferase / (S)-3-amino-2-methylpropionate transaminase / 5-aminovalerate transaminase
VASANYPFSLDPVDVPPLETSHRRISTPLPVPESLPILRTLQRFEPRSMAIDQLPVVWDRAEGYQVRDAWGNCWIDFTSGIFVANIGHGHPRVLDAIRKMLERPLLHNYYFPSEIRAAFVSKLIELTPANLDTAFLLTTGSESTECAIKLMRIHGHRIDPKKLGIISLTLGFHGKTMGSQQAGGRPAAKAWIGKLDPNFHLLPVPYAPVCPFRTSDDHLCDAACFHRSLDGLARSGVDLKSIAGFLIEPYQGWSAAFLPTAYVHAMREWATKNNALVAFDEVQSGFGRTGRFLAYEHFDVEADLVCCGKGITSSLPLSTVLGRRELLDVDPSLNSTHGGNPICCAAGLATLEVLQQENYVERAARLGERLSFALQEIADRHRAHVARVEGRGLVWGLHLVDPNDGALDVNLGDVVTESAMRKGVLLVRTGVGTVKIGPPLCIPDDAAIEGVQAIGDVIGSAIRDRVEVKN